MLEKEKLVKKGALELFGSVAGDYGKARGIDTFYRVADHIDELTERLENRGLNLLPMEMFGDVFYVIYEEGQTFGESFPLHGFKGENEGIWVSDIDRYRELIGDETEKGSVG